MTSDFGLVQAQIVYRGQPQGRPHANDWPSETDPCGDWRSPGPGGSRAGQEGDRHHGVAATARPPELSAPGECGVPPSPAFSGPELPTFLAPPGSTHSCSSRVRRPPPSLLSSLPLHSDPPGPRSGRFKGRVRGEWGSPEDSRGAEQCARSQLAVREVGILPPTAAGRPSWWFRSWRKTL